MKLLQEFQNNYSNITYRLYELDCGLKLIHLENPATLNFDFYTLHNAGCIYENMENVPHGTAHLTEHIINKPNNTFKTLDDIQKFVEGNRSRPALYVNAGTWFKHMNLVVSANTKGTDRVIEKIEKTIDFPFAKFRKALINEKKIVLSERSRAPLLEKDNFIQKTIFLQGKEYPEFTYNIIGEAQDIERINIDDIQKYFQKRFLSKDSLFAIQSNKKLSQSIFSKLEKIGKKFTTPPTPKLSYRELKNRLELGYFYDDRATGTTIDLVYFDKISKPFDYKKESVHSVLNSTIHRIGYLLLREKLGLIYSLETFRSESFTAYHDISTYRFVVENDKIEALFTNLEEFMSIEIEEFIKSEKGTRWIDSVLSKYIYPNTVVYDLDLPYGIAMDYSEYNEIYNRNLYVESAKKITKGDLITELKRILSTPPHIWVESNLPEEEIKKTVKQSNLWKRYSK